MKVTTTGVGVSDEIPVNWREQQFTLGIYVKTDGVFAGKYSVEMRIDDDTWITHTVISENTADESSAVMLSSVQAVRLRIVEEDVAGDVTLWVTQGA